VEAPESDDAEAPAAAASDDAEAAAPAAPAPPARRKTPWLDLAAVILLGAMAVVAVVVVEATTSGGWRLLPAALEPVPEMVALALGLTAGLALVGFAALALRAKSRPIGLLALPGVPIAVACAGQLWIHRAAVNPAGALTETLANGGPALAAAQAVASAGFALGALFLTGAALAFGLAGRSADEARGESARGSAEGGTRASEDRAPEGAKRISSARRTLALVAGALGVVAAPLGLALTRGELDTHLWLGLVPAALGVLAIVAAAGRPSPVATAGPTVAPRGAADALIAAACGLAATVLLAAARGLFGPEMTEHVHEAGAWAPVASRWTGAVANDAASGALFGVPLLLGLAVVLSRPRAALLAARRELAVLGLAVVLPAVASMAFAVHSLRELSGAWPAVVPEGLVLPEAASGAPLCDEIEAERVLFVGPSRVVLGRRDLGPISDLDSDEGCAAIVLAIDVAARGGTLFLAPDSHLRFGPMERLLRALSEAKTGGAPANPARQTRRPRCEVMVLGTSANDTSFPACTSVQIASEDCEAQEGRRDQSGQSTFDDPEIERQLLVLSGDEAFYLLSENEASYRRVAAPLAVLRIPLRAAGTQAEPRAPSLRRVGRTLAAAPDVLAGEVFGLAVPLHSLWGSVQMPRIVPAERVPDAVAPLPPPAPSALVRPVTTVRAWAEKELSPALSDVVLAAEPKLRECLEAPDTKPGSQAFRLLVAADGSVQRVLRQSSPVDDAGCLVRVLAALRFAPSRATVVAVATETVIRRASASLVLRTEPGEDRSAQIELRRALRQQVPDLLACYAPALEVRNKRVDVEISLEVDARGKVTSVSTELRREGNAPLDACLDRVLRKPALPLSPAGSRRLRVRVMVDLP
jgi:hypothetical protein